MNLVSDHDARGRQAWLDAVEWILRRLVAADAALRGEAASEVVATVDSVKAGTG